MEKGLALPGNLRRISGCNLAAIAKIARFQRRVRRIRDTPGNLEGNMAVTVRQRLTLNSSGPVRTGGALFCMIFSKESFGGNGVRDM